MKRLLLTALTLGAITQVAAAATLTDAQKKIVNDYVTALSSIKDIDGTATPDVQEQTAYQVTRAFENSPLLDIAYGRMRGKAAEQVRLANEDLEPIARDAEDLANMYGSSNQHSRSSGEWTFFKRDKGSVLNSAKALLK